MAYQAPDDAADGSTREASYTARLHHLETAWWRRLLDVQRPYRWNLRRLQLGRTLDVGCGIGRNLAHLGPDAVGVDHNPTSVLLARQRGLVAFTPEDFAASDLATPDSFASVLFAHVLEHLDEPDATELVRCYLPYLTAGGRVVIICPQERGQASDPSHVRFVDVDALRALAQNLDLTVERTFSFPFPRPVGRVFTYNETIMVARRAPASSGRPP